MAEALEQQSALKDVAYAGSDFASLLQKEFKPRSDEAKSAVEAAVLTLAQQALANTQVIGKDVTKSIQAMIAAIDQKLTEQVNKLLHHDDFQKLESAWRGLHYMVNNTETDENLKIRVMDVSKKELHKTLKKFKGAAWDQSPLFKKIYEQEYGQFGGEPFGAIVGDYHFDQSPPDVELLGEMAKIAASAHAPFITGASPNLMQMESWQELANPRDLTKIFSTPEYAGWRSLRDSDDSKYIGLCMPRFLARTPYGAKTNPVEDFDFEEDVAGADHSKYPNTARAVTAAILEAGKWIDTGLQNKNKMAETIADKSYVNTSVDAINQRILGRYTNGLGKNWDDPNHMKFYNDGAATFPYLSDGMWFLTQHKRWGLLKEHVDYLAVAKQVNQIELYKQG